MGPDAGKKVFSLHYMLGNVEASIEDLDEAETFSALNNIVSTNMMIVKRDSLIRKS